MLDRTPVATRSRSEWNRRHRGVAQRL